MYKLVPLILLLFFISCGNDEELSVMFLSGNINNNSFSVGQSTFSEIENDRIEFNIFSDQFTSDNVCQVLPEGVRIFFVADSNLERQDLFLDNNSFEAFTVSLFLENQNSTFVATEGFFQILELNSETIIGNLNISVDSSTSIQGQFTAEFCN